MWWANPDKEELGRRAARAIAAENDRRSRAARHQAVVKRAQEAESRRRAKRQSEAQRKALAKALAANRKADRQRAERARARRRG